MASSFRTSYFWDARALARDLRVGRVSESFRQKALITLIAVYFLNSLPVGGEPDPKAFATWFSIAFSFVSLVGSVALCFRMNRRLDDRDFVARFVCLAIPLSIKLIALQVALAIPIGLVLSPTVTAQSPEFAQAEFWTSLAIDVIWFVGMRRYFGFLSEN